MFEKGFAVFIFWVGLGIVFLCPATAKTFLKVSPEKICHFQDARFEEDPDVFEKAPDVQ